MAPLALPLLLAQPALAVDQPGPSHRAAAEDEAPAWAVAVGFEHGSGRYGEAVRSSYSSESTELTATAARWEFNLSVPYVAIDTPAGGVAVDGTIVAEPGRGSAQLQRQRGPGDATAAVAVELQGADDDPAYWLGGQVKFGTADASKGLGTGRNDYSVQAERLQTWRAWTVGVTAGYTWRGRIAAIALRDTPYATVDAAWEAGERLSLGGTYRAERPVADGLPSLREATLYAARDFGGGSSVRIYVTKGLSAASPEVAIGATIGVSF